jgi:ureidoglycolate hydrolase
MAHFQQLKFVEIVSKQIKFLTGADIKGDILEIGSYDVNGTVRPFFPQEKYVGVDLTTGPGVDLVGDGHKLSFPNGYFSVCISCEVFEHNPFWKQTFENMYRMTMDDGFIVMTCASTGRIEHGTTRTQASHSPGTQSLNWDYYKNVTKHEFLEVVNRFKFSFVYCEYNPTSKDLYFFARKGEKKFDKMSTFAFDTPLGIELNRIFIPNNKWSRGIIRSSVTYALDLPIVVAENILADENFQNFALAYYRHRTKLLGPLRRRKAVRA